MQKAVKVPEVAVLVEVEVVIGVFVVWPPTVVTSVVEVVDVVVTDPSGLVCWVT